MDFNQENSTADMLAEKWEPVLEHPSIPSIGDRYKEKVTAVLLENQERALKEQSLTEITNQMGGGGFAVSQAGSGSSNLQGYDPILISLVRRSMPNLMAYDVIGVQPMSAPTGLIFAMRARYDSQTGKEALYQEAFAKFSGAGATTGAGATGTTGAGATAPTGGTTGAAAPGATAPPAAAPGGPAKLILIPRCCSGSATKRGSFSGVKGSLLSPLSNLFCARWVCANSPRIFRTLLLFLLFFAKLFFKAGLISVL